MPNPYPTPAPLSDAERDAYFPLQRPPIAPDVFEIGLALGGTVSAGAYTGGVLDYIIEALDAWTKAKEQSRPDAPQHKVVISTIAGASGGGINGAIVTRAAAYDFDRAVSEQNPFFSAWVRGVDLRKLLSTAPQPGVTGFSSVLNTASIEETARRLIQWKGRPLGSVNSPARRSYFADPLRLIMMLGNVTGIPYSIPFKGESNLAHDLVGHADYFRFALACGGGVANPPAVRPDEFALHPADATNWDFLEGASLATSAFPLAFRERQLMRRLESTACRIAVVPKEDGSAETRQLIPKWTTLQTDENIPGVTHFVNVDGGSINNEPIDFVRMALAGVNGRNARDGIGADRAVVLVDPFSDAETLYTNKPVGVLKIALPFVQSLIYQARFKPQDIALANDDDVYSRFLVAPMGPANTDANTAGQRAIASGGLGGFLGFVDAAFLQYDYLLGRRNAYEFLTNEFVFPLDNPIIKGKWPASEIAAQKVPYKGVDHLPMIPLMKELRDYPPKMPTKADWPKLAAFPPDLADLIEARLDAVFDMILAEQGVGSIAKFFAGMVWRRFRGELRDKAVSAIGQALKDQGLCDSCGGGP